MKLDAALLTYFPEAYELLDEAEAALLNMTQAAGGLQHADLRDDLNAVFRAVHTIKGSGGLFAVLAPVVTFLHTVESDLQQARNGERELTAAWIDGLLLACDHVRHLLKALEHGQMPDAASEAQGERVLALLQCRSDPRAAGLANANAKAHPDPNPNPDAHPPHGSELRADTALSGQGASSDAALVRIDVSFGEGLLRDGMDPLSILHYLQGLGDVVELAVDFDAMPSADAWDAEACYLHWVMTLSTSAGLEAVAQAFEFVRESSRLVIEPLIQPDAGQAQPTLPVAAEPAPADADAVPVDALSAQAMATQAMSAPSPRSTFDRAPGTGVAQAAGGSASPQFVRVSAAKLDALINLVGELVTSGSAATLAAAHLGDERLDESLSELNGHVQMLRDVALRLRMVQIGETFNRFKRIVHDVSAELGKSVELVLRGGETELDKSMVERIADPLVHLVRNALDHGIEPPQQRQQLGKPTTAKLTLHAYHDADSIVIEVGDDGGGLRRDKILARAIERGLVAADEPLTDTRVQELIFEPGFSTADQVTKLSGRGVGMDVVRRSIEALRGSIQVDSVEGAGTTFRIRLPLTLAIIDGFMLSVGGAHYVVPLSAVDECIEYAQVYRNEHGAHWMSLRDQMLPVQHLRSLLGLPPQASAATAGSAGGRRSRESVIVVRLGHQRLGLVVDGLLGESQTVIKPMNSLFASLKLISGATVLGSGDVALILDVSGLFAYAGQRESARCGSAAQPVGDAIAAGPVAAAHNTSSMLTTDTKRRHGVEHAL